MAKVVDIQGKIVDKFIEGMDIMRDIPSENRKKIIIWIVGTLLKDVEECVKGEKDFNDAPFAAMVDSIYQEAKAGCYMCDENIDGNEVPFKYPAESKLCLTHMLKVANIVQSFGINPETLFPGMGLNKIQPVVYHPPKKGGASEKDQPR